jgi:hypothetical protein
MSDKNELFSDIEEIKGNISLGDSTKLNMQSKDTIKFLQKDGKTIFITNVYYVPNMKSNILSIRQLLERKYIIHMDDRFLTLCDVKGQLVAKVTMSNNKNFLIHLNIFIRTCLFAKDNKS